MRPPKFPDIPVSLEGNTKVHGRKKKKDHGIITVYFSVVELSEHLLNTQVGPTGCVILDRIPDALPLTSHYYNYY